MSLRGEYLGMPVLIDDLDKDNQTFYRYCGQNELRAQECLDCRLKRLPPTSACPFCASERMEWRPVEGRGTVYSYGEVHHAIQGAFRSILNLPLIPFLARLINIPYPILLPIVISLSFIGVFLTTFSVFDLGLLIGFAFFATILRVQDYPLAPLLLGFILSSMFEDNVRRTLLLSMGEWSYLSDRPVTIFLLMICLLIWSTPLWYRTKH